MSGSSNSISTVIDFIKENQYYDSIAENTPFFFNLELEKNVDIILGDGSDDNHLNICITSLKLLANLDSSVPGAYHIDGTYKLIKNKFVLIVFGKTDMEQKFHPIAFCISSHEKEVDYLHFYNGLKEIANSLDIIFEPEYIVQDAWLALIMLLKKFFLQLTN